MHRRLLTLALTSAFAAVPVLAQQATPAPTQPVTAAPARPATIHQRFDNQQDRIANGVRSGQLTPRETQRLEARQARIHHEVRADRAANGGRLTPQERRQINRQQNRASHQIYRDKHNAAHTRP